MRTYGYDTPHAFQSIVGFSFAIGLNEAEVFGWTYIDGMCFAKIKLVCHGQIAFYCVPMKCIEECIENFGKEDGQPSG